MVLFSLTIPVEVSLLGDLDEGPIWTAACFEGHAEVILFLFSPCVLLGLSYTLGSKVLLTPILCSNGGVSQTRY